MHILISLILHNSNVYQSLAKIVIFIMYFLQLLVLFYIYNIHKIIY